MSDDESNKERIKALECTINGNGQEGLRTKFARLEERTKAAFNLQKWQIGLLGAYIAFDKGHPLIKAIIATL